MKEPSSLIPHPSSLIPHPSSFILHPSSFISHPSTSSFYCGLTMKSIDDWPTLWPSVFDGDLQSVASGDETGKVIEFADEEVVPRCLVGFFGGGRAIVGHAIAAVVEDLAVDLHRPMISLRGRFDMEVIDFGVKQHLLARGEFRALHGLERAETVDFGAEREVADGQRRGSPNCARASPRIRLVSAARRPVSGVFSASIQVESP